MLVDDDAPRKTETDKLVGHEPDRMRGGLYVFANLLDVQVPLPVEISLELRIETPSQEILGAVRELVRILLPMNDLRQAFEGEWRPTDQPGTLRWVPQPESEWRYLALTFSGWNPPAVRFLEAAILTEPPLAWAVWLMTSEPFGRGRSMGYSADLLVAHRRFPTGLVRPASPDVFDQPAVERLRAAHAAFQALDRDAHPGTYRAITLFSLFQRSPIANSLDVLAMFMIIEMLLTHNPGDKEIGDSLKHQIAEKVPFVFARMGESIDYSCFAPDLREKRAWSLLYDYRSAVAHGGAPDFKNKLSALRDPSTADQFLIRITRRLLRHALDDPGLLEGLKTI